MTLDEAIIYEEEEAEQQDKLCKRYDDTSGYTRSHNEDIRTTEAKKCVKCAKEHRQIAEWLKELKQLREQTRWIPVSERLPDIHNYCMKCLVTDSHRHIHTSLFTESNGKGWWSCDDVIAWMPLPEPYKPDCEPQESDHKCHNCKHYTSGDYDGSCGSYICKGYSNWESEGKG